MQIILVCSDEPSFDGLQSIREVFPDARRDGERSVVAPLSSELSQRQREALDEWENFGDIVSFEIVR